MTTEKSDITVVYLARGAEGYDKLEGFVASYLAHDPGVPHELLVAYKGIRKPGQIVATRDVFSRAPHRVISFDDVGFDINVYLEVAKSCNSQYICFLNTFSIIESDGWLEKLYKNMLRPGVGVVGATASYESIYTAHRLFDKAIYKTAMFPGRYDHRLAMQLPEILGFHAPGWFAAHKNLYTRAKRFATDIVRKRASIHENFDAAFDAHWLPLIQPGQVLQLIGCFPPFPNPHIRSNGFMISRQRLLDMDFQVANTKDACVLFESGPQGLSSRLRSAGLEILLVGADGVGYRVPEWSQSRTFRLEQQQNILISDNQVRGYGHMKGAQKRFHQLSAWGEYLGPMPEDFITLGESFARNPAITG